MRKNEKRNWKLQEHMHPRQPKPSITHVMPLVKALYERWEGGVGCCLHVLLDDGNVEDCFARSSIDRAIERGHVDCERLARLIYRMSWTQRRVLCRRKYS